MSVSGSAIEKLCRGVRAISPNVEIRIRLSPVLSDHFSITVQAGSAILFETDYLPLDEALLAACKRLSSISSRMMAAVRRSDSSPPSAPKSDEPITIDVDDIEEKE